VLIDKLHRYSRKGFYVHAKPRVNASRGISRYIGRYIRHPAIADARIIKYDGEEVTFFYHNQEGKREECTLPVLEFIHGVVRHIPPKHFKMARYFGLYASRKTEQVVQLMSQVRKTVGWVVKRLSWRSRIQRDFQRDPLKCSNCGEPEMELYSLTMKIRGQLKTIGGMDWLFKRNSLHTTHKRIQSSPLQAQPPPLRQLALPI
jgi:hypothetical protein